MNFKVIGAIITILGCGGMGLRIATAYKKEFKTLEQLRNGMDFMECELRYRLTPLPELCRGTADATSGAVSAFFRELALALGQQVSPRVRNCVNTVIAGSDLPTVAADYLSELGETLGIFDLEGQLQGIEFIKHRLDQALDHYRKDLGSRIRSYQTLGLCAGAAIAILLL